MVSPQDTLYDPSVFNFELGECQVKCQQDSFHQTIYSCYSIPTSNPPLTPSTSPPLVRLDLPEPQGGLGAGGGEALAHPLLAGHEVLRAVERAPRLTVPHLQLVDFCF